MSWLSLSFPLQIRFFVESIKLVENYQNVGEEEVEENIINATTRLERSSAVEKNESELHLK